MRYPHFFDTMEKITLQDELSNFLGTFEDGIVEIGYLDVVKNAGHSCPTVLGAYLCALEGLKVLYKDTLPKRGGIKVEFKECENEGVAGVNANVIGHITGATKSSGFKGLAGRFNRCDLVSYENRIDASVRFIDMESGNSVDVYYNPNGVMPNPMMGGLMQKCIGGVANIQEQRLFGELWQERVGEIYKNRDKTIKVV